MGSDSRTATASSKSRPSWRNRHLNQLSNEQLDEVRQHRDGGESVAEMAGIESNATDVTVDTSSSDRQSSELPDARRSDLRRPQQRRQPESKQASKLPRPQAGPERLNDGVGKDRQHEQLHRDYRDRIPESSKNQQNQDDRTGHQISDAARRSDYHDRADHEASARHRNADRYARGEERREYRNEPRSRYESDRVSLDAEETGSSAENKGFVAKVLDYKPPAPLKYGLMAVAIAVLVAVSLLKPIDNSSQSQLDSAFTRAMIGFGLAKTLNGVISVAQGTEFAVQPAGVGVNFSPGEILDPINDLVERFSWVMLIATSSIGVQKILLEVSSWTGISVLLAGAGLFFLLTRLRNSAIARLADIAGKLLLAMLLVRFLIPVGSLANDWVYHKFLQPQYEESSAELEIATDRIREINTRQTEVEEDEGSIADRAKRLYSSMTSKFDFDGMLDDYKKSAETVSENAINLIVVFVLQTIIFPLFFLYLLYRLFRFVILPSKPSQQR